MLALLALPTSWLALIAIYWPQPVESIARVILAPSLVSGAALASSPDHTPGNWLNAILFIIIQVLWFLFLGVAWRGLIRLVRRGKS